MKTHMMIIAVLLLAGSLSAQERNKNKETKEERSARIEAAYNSTAQVIDSKRFVLEADYRSNQYGFRIPVSSIINFVKIDSIDAVIQTGNNNHVGFNGVGGVTAEGRISKWEVTRDDKRKSFYVSLNILSTLGYYNVFMNVMASGNATVTITGTTAGQLNYSGRLVPLEESKAYQGTSL